MTKRAKVRSPGLTAPGARKPSEAGRAIEVEVQSLAPGGEGVLRLEDGRVAFVPGVLVGERVQIVIEHETSKKRQARLLSVLDPSPSRVEPACPIVARCGGCDWMHISTSAQAESHASIVADLIERAVGSRPDVTTHALSDEEALRSRARFAIRCDGRRCKIGYRARRTHEIVEVDRCLVLEPGLVDAVRLVAASLDGARGEGEISVAFGMRGDERRPVVELTYDADPPASFYRQLDDACGDSGQLGGQLAGARVLLRGATRPLVMGDPHAVQRGFDGLPLVISAGGFAQASDAGGAHIAERVRDLAKPEDAKVLELFAGSGTLSVALARGARAFASVEESSDAVVCARKNLEARGLSGTLRVGDAESASIAKGLDVVVLDPPRAGAPRATVAIADAKPRRIVYVSCDPATLGRDLSVLSGKGYVVSAVETVEIFPHTSHVETIVLLRRKGAAGDG